MDLSTSRAIVTGGASGLGLATVEALKKKGVLVVSWDRQDSQNDYQIECDVTNEDSIRTALSNTIEKIGIPNICIQCAGIAPAKRVVGKNGVMPLSEFNQVIQINLVGTFNVLRLVAEKMMQQPIAENQTRGIFIHTASVAAFEGQIGQAAYSASKGGVAAMTLPLAREFAQHQIRINTIAPGIMQTPMMAGMPEEVQIELAKNVPFPHRLGKPEEYAQLAIHLIENDYLNGEVIRLDGGLRMNAK
jgi:NAD(P)-dependent dehydrogenase (short-subunit alcohol dehydrogenase family)